MKRLKKILIVGGGTAGWMAAAALAKTLGRNYCDIELIESDLIGTVGVGEATIPQILLFIKMLGLDEQEFMRETNATFKLGIQFVNWSEPGSSYIHAFGDVGRSMEGIPFYHYWLKMRSVGKASEIDDYTLSSLACHQKKFMKSIDAGDSPLSNIAYAYHFDAARVAKYLREKAESWGVIRTEGKVVKAALDERGYIKSVQMEDGCIKMADFFIDCSGFKGLLIEQVLNTGYEDWSHWLPCNSAVAAQCKTVEAPVPYTRSTALSAGWQWRIPLQTRAGNGYVFCDKFISDQQAMDTLISNMESEPTTTPKILRFKTGRRKKVWNKNCLSLGLASGFMEPLESTSIHLVQSTLSKFFSFFPHCGFDKVDIDEFNRQVNFELERIRDFLILHYVATKRNDSDFWNFCRNMEIPETLRQKIDQFVCSGRIFRFNNEMFSDLSWFEVMLGQGLVPGGYNPLVDVIPENTLDDRLESIKRVIKNSLAHMPSHEEFIKQYCAVNFDE